MQASRTGEEEKISRLSASREEQESDVCSDSDGELSTDSDVEEHGRRMSDAVGEARRLKSTSRKSLVAKLAGENAAGKICFQKKAENSKKELVLQQLQHLLKN